MLKSGKQDDRFCKEMWATICAWSMWPGELVNRRKDGNLTVDVGEQPAIRNSKTRIISFVPATGQHRQRRNHRARSATPWQHPQLGLVKPDTFIRIAENSGLISSIGEWVLRTACMQLRRWQDEGLLRVPVAANVSAVQFRHDGFQELMKRVLSETGLDPQYLELELTESLLLSNADVMFKVLQELKDMGLKLAIDDFGTGYSSLGYLRHFPVTKIKIDRSFIRDVAIDPDAAAITTAIISMSRSLNLKVIAEGVENEAQLSFLRKHNCDEYQGYYFSHPLDVRDVSGKLEKAFTQEVV